MAVTITQVTRDGGAGCTHATVRVDYEGRPVVVKTTEAEIDETVLTDEQIKRVTLQLLKLERVAEEDIYTKPRDGR